MKNRHTVELSGSNMDGSFTTAVSNLLVGWLVVFGLTALLDSISVYIGPSPKREGERRKKG